MTTHPNYKLYYYDWKSRGEPIRIVFAYAGVEYEDCRISFANRHQEWFPLMKNSKWRSKSTFESLPWCMTVYVHLRAALYYDTLNIRWLYFGLSAVIMIVRLQWPKNSELLSESRLNYHFTGNCIKNIHMNESRQLHCLCLFWKRSVEF